MAWEPMRHRHMISGGTQMVGARNGVPTRRRPRVVHESVRSKFVGIWPHFWVHLYRPHIDHIHVPAGTRALLACSLPWLHEEPRERVSFDCGLHVFQFLDVFAFHSLSRPTTVSNPSWPFFNNRGLFMRSDKAHVNCMDVVSDPVKISIYSKCRQPNI